MSSTKVLPSLIWSRSKRQVADDVAGKRALVGSVFVIKKLSKAVEESSHSDEDPQFMVIVFTPAGLAELTFENVLDDLRCDT